MFSQFNDQEWIIPETNEIVSKSSIEKIATLIEFYKFTVYFIEDAW